MGLTFTVAHCGPSCEQIEPLEGLPIYAVTQIIKSPSSGKSKRTSFELPPTSSPSKVHT